MHYIETLSEQRIAVDASTLGFSRPIVASGRMINPPKEITVVPSAPPVTLWVLGTAVDPQAGIVSYQIAFTMEPAASPVDSDQLVDLTVLTISVTPKDAAGLPLVGLLANALGAVVADSVAASFHADVLAQLGSAAAGTFNGDIPDKDVQMTVLSLNTPSPTSFGVEVVVGAVDCCGRSAAAWSRFWSTGVVPAASELFSTHHTSPGDESGRRSRFAPQVSWPGRTSHTMHSFGDVAQPGRAPGLQPGGRGFKSHRLHQSERYRGCVRHGAGG